MSITTPWPCLSYLPNLDAREALQTRQDNSGLTISRDIGIVSPASVTNELNHICRSEENLCAILITPLDQSMLLCFSNEQNKIALFDSHQHGSYGGIIAVATYTQVDNFVSFLNSRGKFSSADKTLINCFAGILPCLRVTH